MTDAEREAALLEAERRMTPGPWYCGDCVSPTLILYSADNPKVLEYIGKRYCDGKGQGRNDLDGICLLRNEIRPLLERVRRYREALNEIASWGQGEQVTGSFDEPYAAQIAREALKEPE